MADTVDVEITADIIATQVEFERDAHSGAILIVEGDSDSNFFKTIIDESQCKIVVAFGKENATGAISKLNGDNISGVLCIVDSDFTMLGVGAGEKIDNVVVTDFHDIEIMLVESESFDKLVDEFASKEKIKKIASTGRSVRDVIYKAATVVGAFRFLSLVKKLSLDFNKVEENNYNFVCMKSLKCNVVSLINSVRAASNTLCFKTDDIAKEIDEILAQDHDRRHLCCGHDVCGIISRALRRVIGSHDEKAVAKNNIERILRIGYEKRFFEATQLCGNIKDWQTKNSDYVVYGG